MAHFPQTAADGRSQSPRVPEEASTPAGSEFSKNESNPDGPTAAECELPATDGIPPHIHELLTRASIQLLAEKQKWYSSESDDATACTGQGLSGASGRQSKREKGSTRHIEWFPSLGLVPINQHKVPGADADRFTYFWDSTTPSGAGYSYSHTPKARFGDQQSDPRRSLQIQINYMDSIATRIPGVSSFAAELQAKESLRSSLKKIAQEALQLYGNEFGFPVGLKAIDLKCFGGLRNGFSLPGEELDLVICNRLSTFPRELEMDYLLALESAFLDAGFGAWMVSETTGPVIGLCENPSSRLLGKIRFHREERGARKFQHERPDFPSGSSKVSANPPKRNNFHRSGGFHAPKDVRIECNLNLSGTLSIHSTELLRCYALCDERVRQVGTFVKMWAKNRSICNPNRGTMGSYGYILMVIHYLMNVASPSLIPNLQAICRQYPGRISTATVNGCEIQYYSDETALRGRAVYNAKFGNRQSVGELLRGFFAYYGSFRRDALRGFHWADNTISIRTEGGILSKDEKGWNTAKNDSNGTRLRYLMAIEDPFEHENNVGTSVTKAGIDAIRTEFCRAWTIIERVQEIPGAGWEWRTNEGDIGEDFLAEVKRNPTRGKRPLRAPDAQSHCQTGNQQDNPTGGSTSQPQGRQGSLPSGNGLPADATSGSTRNERATDCQAQKRGPEEDPFQPNAANSTLSGHHPPSNAARKGPRSQLHVMPASKEDRHRNSLIRPPAVMAKQGQRTCREDFRQNATSAANTMNRLLHTLEPQKPNFSDFMQDATRQSISGEPDQSSMKGDAVPYDGPARSNGLLSPQSISTTARQSHGVALDLRQFHGPSAIRDRSFSPRQRHSEGDGCDSEAGATDSSTSVGVLSSASLIADQAMLHTLPYYEASLC
ncbi:Caffeine-induced death protein [Aspergillus sp. HF37]|nr:Caffeine-induced death protein [Aspergillus sp. HF37]